MTEQDLTYLDFVKEALNARPRLGFLGEVPLNWLAMAGIGTLGVLNPGFLLIGAGLEVAYLVAMAQSPRFRSYVRGRRIQAAKQARAEDWEGRQATLLATLDDEARARFDELNERIEHARDLRGESELVGMIGDVADDGLHKLRWIHLRLLASRLTLRKRVDPALRRDLDSELQDSVRRLEALGTDGDARLRHSLESTVKILRQRLANLEGAEDNLRYIESELRRVEHQAELIIEEAALATDPDALTARIDAVTSTFSETQEWMRLHKELLTEFEDDDGAPPPPQRITA